MILISAAVVFGFPKSRISKGAISCIVVGSVAVNAIILTAIVFILIMRRKAENNAQFQENADDFTFVQMAPATNNFNNSTQIGQGGYGKVYKVILADGSIVAIKRALEGRTSTIVLRGGAEKDKKSLKLGPEDNLYVEGFASNVFAKADKQDRAGRADLNTAKAFYAASIVFEILNQFGELQPDLEQKQKYVVWKAAEIRKALKEGQKPVPGPRGGDIDLSASSSSPIFIEEAERSLHDVIMIVRRALKNSTVVAGGGAIDVWTDARYFSSYTCKKNAKPDGVSIKEGSSVTMAVYFTVQNNFIAQTGDPTGTGKGGYSIYNWACSSGWKVIDFTAFSRQKPTTVIVLQSYRKLRDKSCGGKNHTVSDSNSEALESVAKVEVIQQMFLNYLQDATSTDDAHLFVRWSIKVLEHLFDKAEVKSTYPDIGSVSSLITRNSAKKISLALGQDNSFSRGFDKILFAYGKYDTI
ncbi:hypothetical protein IFM89_011684 [Coptis chinensis]|uniref:Vta1/callose synthase N-terminal domain-containing protein n=1 Tax=Coptis chinensis TaxID=261450 RepID=A0A835LZC0_9MAGN|nr:hypothetical protein IFM89_011684 [Coptis chinensis]